MTYADRSFLVDESHILLGRFSDYVRPWPAKTLARMLGVNVKTAEHFRAGVSWPTARHWRLIVQAFGRDVIACVFEPEINDTLARLRREEAQLEERLDEVRRRRRSAAGDLEGPEERRASDLDRPQVVRDLFDDGARS